MQNPSTTSKKGGVVKSSNTIEAIKLRRLLPSGLFVRRPKRSVHTLVPFIRTLARAFSDLDRAAARWHHPKKAVDHSHEKKAPPRQKAVDDELHAAKRRATSYAATLKSVPKDAKVILVDGKETARSRVVKQLVGTEKYLTKLKATRGSIQTSPLIKVGLEEGTRVKTTRSPSYLRRLELRRLRREVEELKATVPSSLAPQERVEVVEKVVEKVVEVPVERVTLANLEMLKSVTDLRVSFNLPPAFTMAEFATDFGLVRFSRSKSTSKVTAMDLIEKGCPPCRLGRLETVANDTFLKKMPETVSLNGLFLLGAIHSFHNTLPAPFPTATTNFTK